MPKKRSVKRHLVTQPLDESYRLIPLTQGQNAIVDVSDYDWLNQWNWFAHWSKPTQSFYAVRYEFMARAVLGCLDEELPDHVNHITLDNRRDNLRKGTFSQNGINRRLQANNTSGFKGVSWFKEHQKWRADIRVNWKAIYLGMFSSREDAARAYDEAARKYHGEFAVLNFPAT